MTKQNIKVAQNIVLHTNNICSTTLVCPCQRRYNLSLNIGIKLAGTVRITQFRATGFICRNLIQHHLWKLAKHRPCLFMSD